MTDTIHETRTYTQQLSTACCFGRKCWCSSNVFLLHLQMSVQEYDMIQEEDERSLKHYRKQCMQEMHERLSFGPSFEQVHELESGDAFLEVIEKEHRLTLVVVHIYQHGVKG